MILIRYTAVVMLALYTTFAAGVSANTAAERPNILFIYTDDHSYRSVSCYPEAYDWVHTPNINRLAEQGVRFTHAYIVPVQPERGERAFRLNRHIVVS